MGTLFLGFDHAAADGGKGDGRTNDRKGAARSRYSSGFSGLHFGRNGAITWVDIIGGNLSESLNDHDTEYLLNNLSGAHLDSKTFFCLFYNL